VLVVRIVLYKYNFFIGHITAILILMVLNIVVMVFRT
jgi:hypothetical protein